MPDFTQCKNDFSILPDNHPYVYHGPVSGILQNVSVKLITVQGCNSLCGTGPEYYEWADVSATISTWVLPMIGLMLQAPFESNAFFKTIYAIARWTGSPIASLSYVLWNIKVTSRCALMVDMGMHGPLKIC